jgi:hypothetical protein
MWAREVTRHLLRLLHLFSEGQVDRVESTDELRVPGVFYPAGSPTERYEAENLFQAADNLNHRIISLKESHPKYDRPIDVQILTYERLPIA